MTAKEYLGQLVSLNRKIRQKQTELKEIEKEVGFNKRRGEERVQLSFFRSSGDPTASQAIRIVALREKVNDSIVEYLETKDTIIDQIHSLNDELDIDILYRRYVQEEHQFEKIASDMGYSYQYIINRHGKALKNFELDTQ